MRTKTLLAAAALVAAGALTSQAQNVYSLNVVGYVNVTLRPGYNLITPQLVDTANPTAPISRILTNAPALADGSTFFGWNANLQTFTEAANWIGTPPDGPAWYNGDFSGFATDTAPRGKSYFIFNSGVNTATLTLVGEVPQGANSAPVAPGYNFLGDYVPTSGQLLTNGFPVADGSTLFTWDPITQGYTEALNGIATPPDGPAWYNGDFSSTIPFAPAVAQGFVYFNPAGSVNWARNFTVK
jgi:hypothetical protein